MSSHRYPMRVLAAVSVAGLVTALALWTYHIATDQNVRERTAIDGRIQEIKRRYAGNIHYMYDPLLYFPRDYLQPPSSARGSSVSLDRVPSVLSLVEHFLSIYPPEVVHSNLSAIYLLRNLEFDGKYYGGTYLNSGIYIATAGPARAFSENFIYGLLHAEFSSILFHNYQFPEGNWHALNEAAWNYKGGTGFELLGDSSLYDQTEQLLRHGFLNKYSQSSLENDFNNLVEWAFTRPEQLRELASRYYRIKSKYDLAVQFYESIDPRIQFPKPGNNLRGKYSH